MRDADTYGPLAALVDPYSTSEFLERYFERAPLHIRREDPEFFRDVYGIADIESSIVVGGLQHQNFRLVKAKGQPIPVDEMTIERRNVRARDTGRPAVNVLDPRSILRFFDGGYTLLITDASLFCPRLQTFVNRLQANLGFYVQTNVYLTPPNAQGFEVHHDTHDTMVLQIEGSKTWQVYEPLVELPIETQPFSGDAGANGLTLHSQAELGPGDTLYVPHGFPHKARTSASRSLHVTLALCPIRVIDLIEAMLQLRAATDVDLRRALTIGWPEDAGFAAKFSALAGEKLGRISSPKVVFAAAEIVLRDLFAVTRADGRETFGQLPKFAELTPSTTLSLRRDTPHRFRDDGELVELLIAGKMMTFPAAYGTVFRRLEAGPMTVAEIDAMLPHDVGRALMKQLLMENLVRAS